ncbi:hypothetical protein V1227_04630 [Lentzea sp. DG1S-22]|uniref:hypothetical protein n=1 Tax=Lentzea sp. DG1S-22 TaxID=3108822 RepID=UPI002E78E720|nr:hypothetical protein [Lentzea sp. DG1S-22]WVH82045.1 hypothetical protein V1227_04630 [Lentzea sp. DG1S-22]
MSDGLMPRCITPHACTRRRDLVVEPARVTQVGSGPEQLDRDLPPQPGVPRATDLDHGG